MTGPPSDASFNFRATAGMAGLKIGYVPGKNQLIRLSDPELAWRDADSDHVARLSIGRHDLNPRRGGRGSVRRIDAFRRPQSHQYARTI